MPCLYGVSMRQKSNIIDMANYYNWRKYKKLAGFSSARMTAQKLNALLVWDIQSYE